jgi:hypothetical protein
MKAASSDAIDSFLEHVDSPSAWLVLITLLLKKINKEGNRMSVFNNLEGKNVILTERDLEIIDRIQHKLLPDQSYDAYEVNLWLSSHNG